MTIDETGGDFVPRAPEAIVDPRYLRDVSPARGYDVSPDGRFLMIRDDDEMDGQTPERIHVVLNWRSELLERVLVN